MVRLLVLLIAIVLVLCAVIGMLWPWRKKTTEVKRMPRNMTGDEIRQRELELRDELDRAPFGEELARSVWNVLLTCAVDEGLVSNFHRDFCGQGLIRTAEGVKLCDLQDGGYLTGSPIAEWRTEAAFVAFFARQSDFTCSGWDAGEPVFASDDEWYRNNQRLTRERLEQLVKGT